MARPPSRWLPRLLEGNGSSIRSLSLPQYCTSVVYTAVTKEKKKSAMQISRSFYTLCGDSTSRAVSKHGMVSVNLIQKVRKSNLRFIDAKGGDLETPGLGGERYERLPNKLGCLRFFDVRRSLTFSFLEFISQWNVELKGANKYFYLLYHLALFELLGLHSFVRACTFKREKLYRIMCASRLDSKLQRTLVAEHRDSPEAFRAKRVVILYK